MEERRAQETESEFKAIRRGWCFGDEPFRNELLAQMTEQVGAYHYGPWKGKAPSNEWLHSREHRWVNSRER